MTPAPISRPPSRREFVEATRASAAQFCELALSLDGADPRVAATPDWTITDVLGHVAMEPARYRDLIAGGGEWPASAAELPAFNAEQVRRLPTRDPDRLVGILQKSVTELLDVVEGFGADAPLMWFDGDQRVRADVALGTLIGEFVVHGRDIATAAGKRWVIDPAHVPLVLTGQQQVMPGWVNPASARHHTATYDFRVRGFARYIYEFNDGVLEVNPERPRRPDVHIRAEPVTALLLTYGRIGQVRPALTGQILAWGRKPWLAARLNQRFLPA